MSSAKHDSQMRACVAEAIGTYILVFLGLGAVHAAVLTGVHAGLWQIAVVWGVAIALAIYATGALSGTHINPAITILFVLYRKFPIGKAPAYVLSQLLGAFLAAATLYLLFFGALEHFERVQGIARGETGSERSAMVYCMYFPNPAVASTLEWSPNVVGHAQAMLAEGIGTAFLAFFVLALTDARNVAAPGRTGIAIFIGLTVSVIIAVVAPLTQAGLNPARDFGPRLVAWMAGWGEVALPGPRAGFFHVYVLSPILGAIAGGGIYELLLRPGLADDSTATNASDPNEVEAYE